VRFVSAQRQANEKRDCVVIDQAGNIIGRRHGLVEDLTKVTLDVGEELGEGGFPQKICPTQDGGCEAIIYASQCQCSYCSYIFPQPNKAFILPTLQQILSEEDFGHYQFYRQKIKEAFERNYSPGWAARVFQEQH